MASTYSTSLRLELMATGDQSGTWGDTTNTNLGTLLEQAITGVLSVAQGDATLTLTALDGATDQSRNAVINLTGAMTGAQNVVVPNANKLYLIKNSTSGGFDVTVKTAAGSGVAVAAGTSQWVYADGTNVVRGLIGNGVPDTNGNISANSFLAGYATTATAAGTTTLTVASAPLQYFTGTSTQTVTLPVVSTLVLGQSFEIVNRSTGAVTVNSSGGNLVATVSAGSSARVQVVLITGTTAASWNVVTVVVAAATTSAAGIVELATVAEALTGTDTTRAVTPAGLYFPTGHLYGLTLSNNSTDATNDIDIAAGTARDSTDSANMVLASALTKRLDASWAVGSGNGGLDTGSIADTTYHVWLIKRSDTGVVDALFSTSASSPTMPANYDYKRRIGSIVRVSAAIKAFTQLGDTFLWNDPVEDVSVNNLSTTSVSYTLTVPAGIQVEALVTAPINHASTTGTAVYIRSLDQTDAAVAGAYRTGVVTVTNQPFYINTRVRTNTSRQIAARSSQSSTYLDIRTNGYVDTRGRFA